MCRMREEGAQRITCILAALVATAIIPSVFTFAMDWMSSTRRDTVGEAEDTEDGWPTYGAYTIMLLLFLSMLFAFYIC